MPWTKIDTATLPDGDVMTLRRNGDDFEIRIGLYELMSSRNPASEQAMAKLVTACLGRPVRHALIGGLGLGYTVRALLDETGADTHVTVAELVPAVVTWNRGPLADLAGHPLDDPRVGVFAGDVAEALRANPGTYDVILLDVDNGPEAVMFDGNGLLYQPAGIALVRAALAPGGVLCVWAADPSPGFEARLQAAKIAAERHDLDVEGPVVHTLYLVREPPAKMPEGEAASGACKPARRPI
jgi:spermidine synthase